MPPTNTGEDQTQDLHNAASIVFDRDGPPNTIDALQGGTRTKCPHTKAQGENPGQEKGLLEKGDEEEKLHLCFLLLSTALSPNGGKRSDFPTIHNFALLAGTTRPCDHNCRGPSGLPG